METWEVTFDEQKETEQSQIEHKTNGGSVNVGRIERIASAVGGSALIGYALKTRSKSGVALGLLGAGLVYRGATGQCEAYRALGIDTTGANEHDAEVAKDVHIEKSITIARTPAELYQFWRNFENLPRFMENLESVTELGNNRSHWIVKGPAGKNVEWDAEIYNEKENELIAWRSLEGADVVNAGSVHFEEAPGGRGTYLKVVLNYNPPGGKAAALFAKLFGEEPGQLVEHNLKRLKQLVETGEIPTTEGQSSGLQAEARSTDERKSNKLASKAAAAGFQQAATEEVA
ncbi:MAG TPA: SRPBCC family protein [Pyrinomonadaceae bacterium]|nr:SRPBCC family protein [Pyrinomonadaceae bacterium]